MTLIAHKERADYTKAGEKLERKVISAVQPIVSEAIENGNDVNEVQHVVTQAVTDMFLAEQVCKGL